VKPALSSKYHINTLGLFGSVVRNDFTAESDIDILVDFNQPIGVEFIDLANELETLLKRKVDLVSRDGIKPKYFREIQHDTFASGQRIHPGSSQMDVVVFYSGSVPLK
jgi:predicted nucleotidyltransferase